MGAIYMVLGLAVMVPMAFLTEELLSYLSASAQADDNDIQMASALGAVQAAESRSGAWQFFVRTTPPADNEQPGPEQPGPGDPGDGNAIDENTATEGVDGVDPAESVAEQPEPCTTPHPQIDAMRRLKVAELPPQVGDPENRYLWVPIASGRDGKRPGTLLKLEDAAPSTMLPSPFSAEDAYEVCDSFTPITYSGGLSACYVPDLAVLDPRQSQPWRWQWPRTEGVSRVDGEVMAVRCLRGFQPLSIFLES